jgi:hypothetical protein
MALRHALRLDFTPLQNNLAVCAVTVLYFKACLEAIYWMRARFLLMHYSRDLVHVLMSSSVLFWNWYDDADESWRLVALVPAAHMARFLYKVRNVRPVLLGETATRDWLVALLGSFFLVRPAHSKLPKNARSRGRW